MTRIVAGSAGGRTLQVPGRGTRPTSDRVREALFSRLEHAGLIEGGRVLDLYAGSGALGLESASRGAVEVVLVESSRAAADVCRRNAATLRLTGVTVAAEKALTFVQRRPATHVDLAFLDPPYEVAEAELTAVLAGLVDHLAPAAVVVVERSVRSPEPTWPARLTRTDERRYGDTALWFATARGAGPVVDAGPADAGPTVTA